jgi:3-methyladenine DNA glycosylase AlkC
MDPLKEMFNKAFYVQFAQAIGKAYKKFDALHFVKEVTIELPALSLNGRMRNTSVVLRKYLPADYKKAVEILFAAAPRLPKGYTALVLPDFVGMYGKAHFDLSMQALKYFTSFGSSEFAIREFLKTDLLKTLKVMDTWADDEDPHVRRLASEGSRPRLPWSFKLDEIIRNPALTQNILEKLKADEALYVRKSVANHLNDISKENADFMLTLVNGWDKTNEYTRWIVKHASRSLIKKGHAGSLALFNFEEDVKVRFDKFRLAPPAIRLGETLEFQFDLTSQGNAAQKLVIDYAVHYARASGVPSRKVFKLKEITLLPGQKMHIVKKQRFADFTTRKHHPGKHTVEVLINGKKMGAKSFALIV